MLEKSVTAGGAITPGTKTGSAKRIFSRAAGVQGNWSQPRPPSLIIQPAFRKRARFYTNRIIILYRHSVYV